MYDKNAQFDMGWAPQRYPGVDPAQTGSWCVVYDNQNDVAVVWTNGGDAAGVSWLTQSPLVVEIHKHFLQCAAAGIRAIDAYNAARSTYADSLNQEQSGSLSGVNDTLQEMMRELDQNV